MTAAKIRVAGAWVDATKAGKVRIAGAWVDFGPPVGGSENLFGAAVPANRDQADSAITLGVRFTTSTNMTATNARWRFPINTPSASVPVVGGIYRNSDQVLLGSANFSLSPTLDDWNVSAPFSSGIPLLSGVGYTAAIWTPGRYCFTALYTWPVSSAHMASDSSIAARFSTGASITFPTSDFNSNNYFADLVASV